MNNKAFTLVEVLAVVIILSVLALLGIISVESVIKAGTEKAYNAQINEIKQAAENYIKIEGYPSWCIENEICYLDLESLINKKYIKTSKEGKYINPKTDDEFNKDMLIKITPYAENYTIEVLEDKLADPSAKEQGIIRE